ncbi:MAG: YrhK family protein, partial [Rhizobiaceae bacterium]
MPHLFVARPRLHDLLKEDPSARDNFRWETINAIIYKIGGVVFVVGSILFFPSMSAYANLGAWVFFVGSILYLIVTGHDLAEVVQHAKHRRKAASIWDRLEAVAAVSYVAGTLFFTFGSIFFLSTVGLFALAAWFFIIGSLLFVVGATVNVLQIV